jgi:hypothetical protein
MVAVQHQGPAAARVRQKGWISAMLLSVLAHGLVLPPLLARLAERPETPLELTYVDSDDTGDSPSVDPAQPSDATDAIALPKKPPVSPEQPPEEKLAERREQPPKPPEVKPEVKPLEVTVMPHLKMVDQQQFPDEADNKDARYLAQKNHSVAVDTQASQRNLVEQLSGQTSASSPSENQSPQIGEAQQKSAELQDRPGDPKRLPQLAPPPTPVAQMPNLAVAQNAQPSPKQSTPEAQSVGRERVARWRDACSATDNSCLLKQGGGAESLASQGEPSVPKGRRAAPGLSPSRLRHQDYDRIVGYDVAESERRAGRPGGALAGASGRWDRIMAKQALFRSALENFTPNVRVGNQSELGTRAHPFAAYIAQVHRQIHRFWGDGFLADLDRKVGSRCIRRKLGDGARAVDQARRHARSGGDLQDRRACCRLMLRRSMQWAAPRRLVSHQQAIKSRDGNVYITWHFHRDERQCATDFVNAHILTTPPKAVQARGRRYPRRASRCLRKRPSRGQSCAAMRIRKPLGIASSAATSARWVCLKAVGSSRGAVNRHGRAAAPIKAQALTKVPDDAKSAAERWLDAFERKDAKRMSAGSALPFTSGGKTDRERCGHVAGSSSTR